MSTTIFYFSGTGDSLKVARDIAGKLEDATVIPISTAIKEELNLSAERIGIVFPVHMFGIPPIVSKFIKKINNSNRDKYFFVVTTYGGKLAGTLLQIEKMLKSKGLKLSSSFAVLMNRKKESYEVWDKRVDDVVAAIRNKCKNNIDRVKFMDRFILTPILNRIASLLVHKMDKKFIINDKCKGCGTCQKVCPVENIILQNNKPVWRHNCEQCFACFNWCPEQAIHFGKNGERYRYNNPFIELKDFPSK